MSVQQTCKIEGCERLGRLHKNGSRYLTKGMCSMHWQRLYRGRDMNMPEPKRYRHGMHKHKLYSTWEGINQRCNNPNYTHYKNYGGRGIKVCKRWGNFANFLEDMGEKPTPTHTLDRINNDGDYEPKNVRWATRLEQSLNQRIKANNTSGYKGIGYDKNNNSWYATITIDYKNIYLGSSKDKEVALKIRHSAEIVYQHCKKQNPSDEGSA